jgi:EmrB/QacA subfamily drug resistance transporter
MPSAATFHPAAQTGRAVRRRQPSRAPRVRRPGVVLAVILVAQLMVVLDATIVNVALPHIERGLHFSATGLSWVINAYILTFGGLLLLGARAGDLAGRRRVFLAGIAIFAVSSLAGGLAVDSTMLLVTRALQGVGAAFAAPCALSLLTTMFPEGAARLRAIALYTTVSAAGGAVGLVAGGLLTELVSWRWVMFVNVPIGVAVWVIGRAAISETPRRHGRLDAFGAVTSTAGMGGIVLGLVEAGGSGWTSPVVIGAFVVGAVMLALFVHNESRAEEPILPLRLFAHGTRTTANVARGLVYAGMYGMFFFLSQYVQDIRGYSPVVAGLAFLPIPLTIFASSQLASRVLVRIVPEKVLMLSGVGIATVAMLLTTMLGTSASYGQILVSLVLIGAGSGISFVSLTSASLADVAPGDAGAASGLVNVSQQLGAAVGLAVLVTVFGALTHHGQVGPGQVTSFVTAMDHVFAIGGVFLVVAFVLIAALVRTNRAPVAAPAPVPSGAPAVAPSDASVRVLAGHGGERVSGDEVVLAEVG